MGRRSGGANPFEPALLEFLRQLDAQTDAYWVDAGSLLGIVREGRLLPWDRDIDLGVWADDQERVLRHVTGVADGLGLRVKNTTYRGRVYKTKLRSSSRLGRVIDITYWWRGDGTAVAPQTRNMPTTAPRGTPRWWLVQIVRQPMIRVVWPPSRRARTLRHRLLGMDIGMYSFAVPAELLEGRSRVHLDDHNFSLNAPARPDRYLQFRYGDWTNVRRDFVSSFDDGAVVEVRPEVLLPQRFA